MSRRRNLRHLQRPGQPVELATAYVMLADLLSSYVSGTTVGVSGGKAILCNGAM